MSYLSSSLFIVWIGVIWAYVAGTVGYGHFKWNEANLVIIERASGNMVFSARIILVVESVSIVLGMTVVLANKIIKSWAINNYEDARIWLNQINRQAIEVTSIGGIVISSFIAAFLWIFWSGSLISLACQVPDKNMRVEDKRFIIGIQISNIVVSVAYTIAMYLAFRDTGVIYLADVPDVQPEHNVETDGIEMEPMGRAEPPLDNSMRDVLMELN